MTTRRAEVRSIRFLPIHTELSTWSPSEGTRIVGTRECRQCKQPIFFESQRVTINRPAADNDDRIEFELCLACWETLIYNGAMTAIR